MLEVKLSLSTISSQLWKNMQTLFIYRVSKKKTDTFEMQISRTALLQFDRRTWKSHWYRTSQNISNMCTIN